MKERQGKTKLSQIINRIYRSNYDSIKKKFLKLQEEYRDRKSQALLSGNLEDQETNSINDKLREQNERLNEARSAGEQAHIIAVETVDQMNANNRKLEGGISRVRDINSETGKGGNLITRMLRRENIMKVVTTVIIGAIVITFLVILYFKVFK